MQDSIQTRPSIPVAPPPPKRDRGDEDGLPVIPSNAAELVGHTTLHQFEAQAPVKTQAQHIPGPIIKSSYGVPQFLRFPYVAPDSVVQAGDVPVLPADSTALDSLAIIAPAAPVEGEIKEGIVLIDPAAAYREQPAPQSERPIWGSGMSWIYLGLTLLFCLTAVKFKGSTKYLKALLTDLTDTRVRHNVFDDTVKETSLLVLLNLGWIASTGILLWIFVNMTIGSDPTSSLGIPDRQAEGLALCMGVTGVYQALIFLAYSVAGNVFTDRKLTRLWLKGAGASSALETFALFPIALLALNYPHWEQGLLIAAAAVFVIGKLFFLYKGFRIFSHQISSWLLFLYYLCSLEIVPLILTYVASLYVCTSWL